MPEISVIIPCYNSLPHIKKCFETLENQTFKDFEVIVIEDCSDDDSYKWVSAYQNTTKMELIVLKNLQNMGPGRTRNRGIENASGKYLLFLDADDYLAEDTLEQVYGVLRGTDYDAVLFDYFLVKGKRRQKGITIYGADEGEADHKSVMVNMTGSTWCKLYKKEVIWNNQVRFPELTRNEDSPFNRIAMAHCQKVYYLKKNLYFYVQHKNSLMHNSSLDGFENTEKAFTLIRSSLEEDYPKEVRKIFITELLYPMITIYASQNRTNREIKNKICELEQQCVEWYKIALGLPAPKYKKTIFCLIKKRKIYQLKCICAIMNICKKILR